MRLIRTDLTWYAYLLSGLFNFIINMLGSVSPFLREELGLSYAEYSLHPSALAAGMMATGLYTERMLDTFGRRWTCLIGVGGAVCGLIAVCLAPQAAVSIAGCALLGLTGGMLPGISGGLLADLHPEARDQAFTECGAVNYACAITANFATGIAVGVAFGWRGALLFGGACALLLMAIYFRRPVPDGARRDVRGSNSLPRASSAYLIMLGLGVALEVTMLLWSPAYLVQIAGLAPTAAVTAAAAFPAAMLVGRSAGSLLVKRIAPEILYPAALCLMAPGFLAFWGGYSAAVTISGLFVAGLAISLLYPLSLSFAVGAAGPAGAAASARSALAAGFAVLSAPFALGALADRVGLSGAYLIAPVLAVVILIAFAATRRLQRREARAWSRAPV